jgi:hypothetical protein
VSPVAFVLRCALARARRQHSCSLAPRRCFLRSQHGQEAQRAASGSGREMGSQAGPLVRSHHMLGVRAHVGHTRSPVRCRTGRTQLPALCAHVCFPHERLHPCSSWCTTTQARQRERESRVGARKDGCAGNGRAHSSICNRRWTATPAPSPPRGRAAGQQRSAAAAAASWRACVGVAACARTRGKEADVAPSEWRVDVVGACAQR